MKKTTLVLASLAAISSCAALALSNNVHASYMPPSQDIEIGDVCIYSDIDLDDYFDREDNTWKKKEHICDGKVEGISYDEETNILTLNNYTGNEKLNVGDHDGLTINLVGENKIEQIDATWMDVDKDFTITGPGSLTIEYSIDAESGANFHGAIVIDGTTLKIKNGGIHFYIVKIKNSNVDIESVFSSDKNWGSYHSTGIIAHGGLTVEDSNINIKTEIPIFAGKLAKKEDDRVDPIILKGVRLGEGLKVLTRTSAHSKVYTEATIGNATTKFIEGENCGLGGYICLENIPTSVTIIKDSGDELVLGATDIIEGADQEMNMKEIKDLVIRYNRDVDSFTKVAIDGNVIPKNQYTLESGSTILTIKADYVKNLKAGEHTVAAYFEGDEDPIETSFTLTIKSANTGAQEQETNFLIAFSLVTLPILAITIYSLLRIKNRIKNKVSF